MSMSQHNSLTSADPDVSRHGLESIWWTNRPGVHSPVDRRSTAPRRAGADIARALPVGWPRPVTAGGLWVVLPGRLARGGQRSLRPVGVLCVAGYREGRPGVAGVGLAVVPGQGIAGLPGLAGEGVVASLASGNRKMGDGHGEAPGT